MKKMIAMSAICMAGMVFAQEPVAPAEGAAPAEPPKCECAAGKPCECAQPCKCGEEMPAPRKGELRHNRGPKGEGGMRQGRGPNGMGPEARRPPMPKFKKCECSPECKGVIILPPDSPEGEPIFKLFPRPEGNGPRPEGRGPRPGMRNRHGKGPQAPVAPEAPAPQAE